MSWQAHTLFLRRLKLVLPMNRDIYIITDARFRTVFYLPILIFINLSCKIKCHYDLLFCIFESNYLNKQYKQCIDFQCRLEFRLK